MKLLMLYGRTTFPCQPALMWRMSSLVEMNILEKLNWCRFSVWFQWFSHVGANGCQKIGSRILRFYIRRPCSIRAKQMGNNVKSQTASHSMLILSVMRPKGHDTCHTVRGYNMYLTHLTVHILRSLDMSISNIWCQGAFGRGGSNRPPHYVSSTQRKVDTAITAAQNLCCPHTESLFSKPCLLESQQRWTDQIVVVDCLQGCSSLRVSYSS